MGKKSDAEAYWIGFDLGGTKMLSQIYDHQFNRLAQERERTNGHEGADSGVERIIKLIQKTLKSADIESGKLSGIGIGCPGPLDLDEGIIVEAPNLGWKQIPIRKMLESEFACPVTISNDVDAGMYGEYRFGAAQGARTALGIFPGTGIGGGCVYDGQILRGKTGSCMEVGHVQVVPEGPLCGCGRRGCLEAVASRLAIATAAATAAYRGEAPYLMEYVGTDMSKIRSKALSKSVKAGDTAIEAIISNAAHCIGTGVGDLVNLLSPDCVVLGGGLVEALPNLFVPIVTTAANSRCMPAYVDSFSVVAAKLADDATAMGAAAWCEQLQQRKQAAV